MNTLQGLRSRTRRARSGTGSTCPRSGTGSTLTTKVLNKVFVDKKNSKNNKCLARTSPVPRSDQTQRDYAKTQLQTNPPLPPKLQKAFHRLLVLYQKMYCTIAHATSYVLCRVIRVVSDQSHDGQPPQTKQLQPKLHTNQPQKS